MVDPDLLTYYRNNRALVDIIADGRALFVLGLADHLRRVTVEQLREHSGLEPAAFATSFAKLLDNRMVGLESSGNTDSLVRVLPDGAATLAALYNLRARSRQDEGRWSSITETAERPKEQDALAAIAVLQSSANDEAKTLAFDRLYRTYNRHVMSYVRRRSRNQYDADDIAIDAWERVLRAIPKFQPGRGSFLAYAIYITGHAAIDYYRRQSRHGYTDLLRSEVEEFAEQTNLTDSDTGDRWLLDSPLASPPEAERDSERAAASDAITTFLHRTFESNVAPHALIAFGLMRLLDLRPREIQNRFAERTLSDLTVYLEQQFQRETNWPPNRVSAIFSGLRRKMDMRLFNVQQWTPRTMISPRDRVVGETTLGEYFGQRERNAHLMLSRWTDQVMKLAAKAAP